MKYVYVKSNEELITEYSDFLDDLRRIDAPSEYSEALKEIIYKVEEDIEELEKSLHYDQTIELEELNKEYRRSSL